jgi:hypothetical protein
MITGGELIGRKVKVLFEPIKQKRFYDNATVLRFNKNLKTKKYLVRLTNGSKYRINFGQIAMFLD